MAARGDFGSFIPTTQVWDVSEVYSTEVTSPAFKELLVRLYQNINMQSISVNAKDSGYYNTSEFVNGQLFFPNPALDSSTATTPTFRQVFRKVINFGALPNTAAKTAAHGITVTDAVTFTRIYATATNTTAHAYIPIPYASSVLANNIELSVDGTNVTITTGSDRTAFNVTYVVLEYLKS
jgi:hypothetical protein